MMCWPKGICCRREWREGRRTHIKIKPTNESELIFRFAQEMPGKWELLYLRTAFPDAALKIGGKVYQVEFEFRAANFLAHGHAVAECDLIICWEDNWPDCPLPIIEVGWDGWASLDISAAFEAKRTARAEWKRPQPKEPSLEQKVKRAEAQIVRARAAKVKAVRQSLRQPKPNWSPDREPSPELEPPPTLELKIADKPRITKEDGTSSIIVPLFSSEYRPPKCCRAKA